jgi:hypothetical protein
MYTFLDSDFNTLIENRNDFQFAQDVCAKSSGKLTCLKPRKISWLFPFKQYPVVTLSVSFLLFRGDKDNHTIFFFCVQSRWAGEHWSSLRKCYRLNQDLVDCYAIYLSQMTTNMFHLS